MNALPSVLRPLNADLSTASKFSEVFAGDTPGYIKQHERNKDTFG
jgi:hypothetical protein